MASCDIASLVWHYNQLVHALSPINVLYDLMWSVLHWDNPFLSSIVLVLSCVLLTHTYYIQCVMIGCTLLLFGTGYLKCIADENVPDPILDPIYHLNPVYYSLEPASESAKVQVLEKYKKIIIQIQHYLIAMNQMGDALHRVYTWQDPTLTYKVLLSSITICLLPMFVPINIILLFGVIAVFCWNQHFYKVLGELNQYMISYILSKDESDSLASTTSLCDSEIEDMCGETLDENLLKALGTCKGCYIDLTATKRVCCSNCGNSFCLNCCCRKVSKELLGVTNPDTMHQEIAVCGTCYILITAN